MEHMRMDEDVIAIVRQFHREGKVIASEQVPDGRATGAILAQGVDVEPLASNQRNYGGVFSAAVVAMCIGYTLFHILVMNFYPLEPWAYRLIHVTGGAGSARIQNGGVAV